ncbi:MSHA biogenesis protein MshL [hydrothermal vent metagenome]|uniref:MSHA biogenesis protein MshL n=1 Tax=hydrothermal vent metagenome TaxID=652676 RepID=A0A1W1D5I7_9ZZZZ
MKKLLLPVLFTLLIPSYSSAVTDCSFELFNITTSQGTRIVDFIDHLSDECEMSIVVTDKYAEKKLQKKLNKIYIKNLTLDEVLHMILDENNLFYSLKNNTLKISYLETKIFNINYILSTRKGRGSTDITLSSNSGSNGNNKSGGKKDGADSQSGITIDTVDEVQFWADLDKEFQSVLNMPQDKYKALTPIINKNAGLITVTATKKQMDRFETYLKKLQKKVQLQVLIDVQLLSVTMSGSKTTGIDWKQLYALQNASVGVNTLQYKNVQSYGQDGSITSMLYGGGKDVASMVNIKVGANINEVIKFLKTQGKVKSISNPKVLTLNNQPALITAGTEYFYKISSTETLSSGSTGTQNSNENIQSVFAGVLLSITPEISDNDRVTLIVNPSLSETSSDVSQNSNVGRVMPPDLRRRQLSSVVTVKDGHKIILGGLINTKNIKQVNKIPLLGDIPLLGTLFSYNETSKIVEELVIVIEPHIIRKQTKQISLSNLGYTDLNATVLQQKK